MEINEKDYEFKVTAAGRVNIIGEHVDYCGGKVFPAALSLKNTIYVKRNGTDKINLSWTTLPNKVTLDINDLESARTLKYGNYQAGCALYWQEKGHKLVGCDMLYDCTVPFGSGLSSSAAIEVSTIAALATIADEIFDPVDVALTAQRAEREFAGVNCGIMDQYASACGRKNHAMLLDCKTLECEYVPIELKDYSLVIINCKKPHNLVESKYNERRYETEVALKHYQQYVNIECLADLSITDLEKYKNDLDEIVYNRCKHVVFECDRVLKAESAMKSGDVIKLGKLLNESHESLKNLYEVTGIELDTLVELAQSHPACIGSRMTGAGFGGCTVSIVKSDSITDFKSYVLKHYENKIGYVAEAYDATIEEGITVKII